MMTAPAVAQNLAEQPLTGAVVMFLFVYPEKNRKENPSTCEGLFGKILRNGRCCVLLMFGKDVQALVMQIEGVFTSEVFCRG